MGKWSDIIKKKKIPRLGEEPEYQEKIDLIKRAIVEGSLGEEYDGAPDLPHRSFLIELFRGTSFKPKPKHTTNELLKLYIQARLRKEAIEEELYIANMHLTAMDQLAVDRYENEELDSIRMETGDLLYTQIEPHVKIEDEAKFRAWTIKQKLGSLYKIPWQTVNKLGKEALEKGQPTPPGTTAWNKAKLVWRRAKE